MKLCFLVLGLAACTRPNPAVCCLDKADCNEVGLGEVRDCNPGLACVDHQCEIPSCAITGCMAGMPVCNITTDVCEGCTESSQCSRFADTDVCDTSGGACVECVAASDCDPAKPVCDLNACRACRLDSECPSGACGDDGSCVAESAIAYVDAGGQDAGSCSRALPCRSLGYAAKQTSALRPHIVMAVGGYVDTVFIQQQDTSAMQLFIHGGGATLTQAPGFDSPLLNVAMSVSLRDLECFNGGGQGLTLGVPAAHVFVERVKVHGGVGGISTTGMATIQDTSIENSTYAVTAGGSLTLDRVVIRGGVYGLYTGNPISISMSNALIYGMSDRAIDLTLASGTIQFSTVADAGAASGTGPSAVNCNSGLTVRSSIIWTPNTSGRAPIAGCNMVSTIAGPYVVPGAMNMNPVFVDANGGNYHLGASSPARDAVDSGPPTDFEGDPRPQGVRFDIGADEATN